MAEAMVLLMFLYSFVYPIGNMRETRFFRLCSYLPLSVGAIYLTLLLGTSLRVLFSTRRSPTQRQTPAQPHPRVELRTTAVIRRGIFEKKYPEITSNAKHEKDAPPSNQTAGRSCIGQTVPDMSAAERRAIAIAHGAIAAPKAMHDRALMQREMSRPKLSNAIAPSSLSHTRKRSDTNTLSCISHWPEM